MRVLSIVGAAFFSIATLAYVSSAESSAMEHGAPDAREAIFEPTPAVPGSNDSSAVAVNQLTQFDAILARVAQSAAGPMNMVNLYKTPVGQYYDIAHGSRPEAIKPVVLDSLIFAGAFLVAAVGTRAAVAIIEFLAYLISLPPWTFLGDIVAFLALVFAIVNLHFHRKQAH
jgi:hypothetical protein